ncbi:DUF1822 family protein [Iningainema tapete]|uniref:DUF1822 family protein n=1 Tax=Iningainema tapete BLCC-T55 TaxID=2748662 RepID=A0A8J6Y062_9CYAN|nr:DUF1822 family protein [Iningainema tapete]MBD2776593.1 DUF1822 family protein [Iningainema tapete BLCC-T55]
MKLNIQTLSQIYSEHTWLELTDSDLKQAQPSQDYSNETGRNFAYLNRLCLNAFLKWMQEIGLSVSIPNEKLPLTWEFVNGCAINVGSKKLVLIPSDAIDIADFAVPQEWVDIPDWAADYYLPIRVDLQKQYLHFWGFISRRSLKAKADYDPIYRLYYVERDWVIPNLESLVIAANILQDEKGEVTALPKLSQTEVEKLIEELSQDKLYSPRLKANFEKWGALLNKSAWLQRLYELRVQPGSPTIWNLSRWLDGVALSGWQTFEELFNSKIALAFRGRVRGIELETPEKVRRAVRQLYNSQSEVNYPDNIEERNALVHLLQNTTDETIRWKAAEYLWTIAPNYQGNAIRNVMDLGVQMMGYPIALMVAVLRKLDGKVAVLLRAYPISSYTLPPGLRLTVLYENGTPILGLEAVSRSERQDDYISLYFSADVGDRFNVRLTLENTSITEQFVV